MLRPHQKHASRSKDPMHRDSRGIRPAQPTPFEFAFGERRFFQPVDDKADDEALRDWESEGGAVPASSLPTPS
jgi:hypothetical protein